MGGPAVWPSLPAAAGMVKHGGELIGCQMTLKRRVDQGTGRRPVKRCLAMELNRKAGNPGLAANAQIQNLQHVIEFSQIVVDQMDGKVGRLLTGYTPSKPVTLRVVARLCASS